MAHWITLSGEATRKPAATFEVPDEAWERVNGQVSEAIMPLDAPSLADVAREIDRALADVLAE